MMMRSAGIEPNPAAEMPTTIASITILFCYSYYYAGQAMLEVRSSGEYM